MARLAYHTAVVAVLMFGCLCKYVCVRACVFCVLVGGSLVGGARMKALPL